MSEVKPITDLLNENKSPKKRKFKEEITRIPAKIYHIDKEKGLVYCDCIIGFETDNPVFEKRVFPKYLMEYLKLGELALIYITTQSRSLKMNVLDGKDIVDASLFDTNKI